MIKTLGGLGVASGSRPLSTHLETYSAYDCGVKRPFAHVKTTNPLIAFLTVHGNELRMF